MEPEIAALASTAGTTIVTLMATDAWQRTREGITSLWRRVHPARVEAVAAELDAAHEDLLSARTTGDPDTERELVAEWQGRIRRLLAARPEVAEELRTLLDELDTRMTTLPAVAQQATASGHARIYQAGRDQNVIER